MADKFNIALYTTKSAKNKLNKSLKVTKDLPTKPIEGTLRNESSVMNPSIIIHANEDMNNKIGIFNYAYIPKFGRYYYITNIQSIRTYIWRIDLHCDVLMTYKEQIKDCDVMVVHQEDDKNTEHKTKTKMTNKMVNDGTYKVAENTSTKVIDFQNGEDTSIVKNNTFYILSVLGGQYM